MKKKRILALILSVAMLVGIMPKLTLFATETETADTATVYVDGTNGSDDAAGTAETPFKTIAKAMSALEDTENENQVIKIIGEYAWSATDGTEAHSKMITITGNDTAAKLSFSTAVHIKGGSLRLEDIALYYSAKVKTYCYGNELVLGTGVTTTFPSGGSASSYELGFGTGVYYTAQKYTTSHKLTVDSGDYYQLFLGDSAMASGTSNEIPGVEFTMNGGSAYRLYIGGDGWATTNLGTSKFTGNVNLTINGGTINMIQTFADARIDFNNNAVQLICNNGVNPTLGSNFTEDNIQKYNGTFYYLKCAAQEGSYLEPTETAGTYKVVGELTAVATDASGNTYKSSNATLTVPSAGTYEITWVNEGTYEVYVSASGDDSNAGTKEAPFKTIAKATSVLDGSTSENQVIKIIGEYAWAATDGTEAHSKMITITGNDTAAKVSFSATSYKITGGSLKFENITLHYGVQGVEMFCHGNELMIGDNVATTFANGDWTAGQAKFTTGTYHTSQTYTESHKFTMNSGEYYQIFLGDSVITTGNTQNVPGVDFAMNGGKAQVIYVGGNGWSGNEGTNKYTDNVNLTINGGIVNGRIHLYYSRVNFDSHAVQLICNNGTTPTLDTGFTKENVEACGGTFYYLKCAAQEGSYLETTKTAGTYKVAGELTAVATDASGNTYKSEKGTLTVPNAGIYTVTWALNDSPLTVFINEQSGDDEKDGLTEETAVKTLNKAVETIQNSNHAIGTIKVVGTVTIDGTTQNNKLTAHSKMITIQGNDSASILYLNGKTLATNGPLTIDNITITLSAAYIGFDSDTYEFNLGENIINKTTPYMRVEAGPSNADSEKLALSMSSGNLQQMLVGIFNNTDGTTNNIAGFDYVQNGGQLTAMLLGSNAWEADGTNFYSTTFTDHVNITLNGGQLGEIRLMKPIAGSVSQQNRDVFFKAAVQILINDEGYLASELPEFNAEGGLWVMNGHGSGYNLTVTETAGVYNVPEGVTAIAYSEDGSRTYVSEDGVLTVDQQGTYNVEYKAELDYANSGTVITFYKEVTVTTLEDFRVKEIEGKLFVGWMDKDGNAVTETTFNKGDKLTAKFINCSTEDNGDFFIKGTQIQESGEGMRIVVQLGNTVKEQLSDVKCGSVYIFNKMLGTRTLIIDGNYWYDGQTRSAQTVEGVQWKITDTDIQYTSLIDNISVSDYQADYAIKGYLTYTDLNGVSRTLYTNELVTGVNDTAEKLLEIDAEDASLLKIIAAGKVAMQAMYSGENAVTGGNIVKGTIGSNFNGGTINGTNGEVAMIYNQLDNGLTVRNVTIDAVNGNASDEATTVVQISDPHFNYCNSEDIAEGNPSTMSTWENRHLNKLWHTNSDEWMTPIYNFANSLEYAKAYGDQTVITGDVVDYISNGTLALMKRYINAPHSDALVTLGNHDPIRVMGLSTDVPDVTSLDSRYNLLKANWNNDVYYTSKMVSEEVMVIQLDNSQNKFWASQIPLLTEDLTRARENDYTVLLFMHVPMATGYSTDTEVEALIGMDNNSNNFYNGGVIKASTNSDTERVCDLITTHADVIKGIFTGHMHSDYYTEVQATDANGYNTYIPQYVLTGNFYGKGHVLKITVQ